MGGFERLDGRAVLEQVAELIQPFEHTDFAAVSYTHLRAHETVLDLVCRLLLEKKKIPTTSSVLHSSHTLPHLHNITQYHPVLHVC